MSESFDSGLVMQAIESQYRAALQMLSRAITSCPEELWLAAQPRNKFWHVAFHAVFYAHLYLHRSEAEVVPWTKYRLGYQFLGAVPHPRYAGIVIDTPYSKAEVLEFLDLCCNELGALMRSAAMDAPSGFFWLPFSRLEAHLYNIRHIQHHTGQLLDRLRAAGEIEIPWVIAGQR